METLVALAGQIVGTSMSPELWLGVVVAVALGRTYLRAMVGALIGAAIVVAIRLAVIGVNSGTGKMVLATLAAIVLWGSLGYLIRRVADRV